MPINTNRPLPPLPTPPATATSRPPSFPRQRTPAASWSRDRPLPDIRVRDDAASGNGHHYHPSYPSEANTDRYHTVVVPDTLHAGPSTVRQHPLSPPATQNHSLFPYTPLFMRRTSRPPSLDLATPSQVNFSDTTWSSAYEYSNANQGHVHHRELHGFVPHREPSSDSDESADTLRFTPGCPPPQGHSQRQGADTPDTPYSSPLDLNGVLSPLERLRLQARMQAAVNSGVPAAIPIPTPPYHHSPSRPITTTNTHTTQTPDRYTRTDRLSPEPEDVTNAGRPYIQQHSAPNPIVPAGERGPPPPDQVQHPHSEPTQFELLELLERQRSNSPDLERLPGLRPSTLEEALKRWDAPLPEDEVHHIQHRSRFKLEGWDKKLAHIHPRLMEDASRGILHPADIWVFILPTLPCAPRKHDIADLARALEGGSEVDIVQSFALCVKTFQAMDIGIANFIDVADRPAVDRKNRRKPRGLPPPTPSSPIRAGLNRYRMWMMAKSRGFEPRWRRICRFHLHFVGPRLRGEFNPDEWTEEAMDAEWGRLRQSPMGPLEHASKKMAVESKRCFAFNFGGCDKMCPTAYHTCTVCGDRHSRRECDKIPYMAGGIGWV